MKIEKMVEGFLKTKGYDGLFSHSVGGEACGCEIGDLFPCLSYSDECMPGFKHKDGLMYADPPE
jgi:hypothetical protein